MHCEPNLNSMKYRKSWKTPLPLGKSFRFNPIWFGYLKLFEENLGECLPEVRRAEDGLDDDHSSVAWIHQQVPNDGEQEGSVNADGACSVKCRKYVF